MKAARFRNYHHFMILNDTCFDFGWMIRMIRFQILVKASTTKWANCSSLSHSKDLRKTVAPKNMCRFLKMFQSDQSYNLKWSLEKKWCFMVKKYERTYCINMLIFLHHFVSINLNEQKDSPKTSSNFAPANRLSILQQQNISSCIFQALLGGEPLGLRTFSAY